MFFIIKYAPEIITKSKPVRKQMSSRLQKNLKTQFSEQSIPANIKREWDKIIITAQHGKESLTNESINILNKTSGIAHFLDVNEYEFSSLDDIIAHVLALKSDELAGKQFVVRCKRTGKHSFTSHEVEQIVGGGILKALPSTRVNLKQPDITIHLEISGNNLYIVNQKHPGIGGYPLGEVDPVLSLISGGFDSSVSSYMTMRRGMPTHFCFFNLGGREHELAVKEVAYYLWQHFGAHRRVKFITVPFEPVVAEILTNITNSQMGVVLKRMMLRAASKVAETYDIQALVTGEAIAQVSSQTLVNLAVIDKVTDKLVLRPLITSDKEDIIAVARTIGTEVFSASIPEYCGVISVKPTTRAKLHKIENEEEKFNFDVLQTAIENADYCNIDQLSERPASNAQVSIFSTPQPNMTLIDIRHPMDQENKPLTVSGQTVLAIPFYSLRTYFDNLKEQKAFLLYCDKGVMSRLHASHLVEEGFKVGVYRPDKQKT